MKTFWLICLLTIMSTVVYAQKNYLSYPYAFQKSDVLINAGLSLAHWKEENYANSYPTGSFPAISLAIEYGVTDELSIGPFASFYAKAYRYTDNNDSFIFHANGYFLGGRASFHFSPYVEKHLIQYLDSEKMDLYISIGAGYKNTYFPREEFRNVLDKGTVSGLAVGGMRYIFTNNFGLFAELGYTPFALAIVGLGLRL